jgi:hypothetical protein
MELEREMELIQTAVMAVGIPDPETLAMMLLGLSLLGAAGLSRRAVRR